jgi:signal transduction histidine kinase
VSEQPGWASSAPAMPASVDVLLDEFLHDVRTPLAAIRGAAEILLNYGDDERVRTEFSQAITAEAERMDDAILDAVRLLRDRLGPAAEPGHR